MKKVELIFVPAPGVGHLVSTLEFAERLLSGNDRLLITILVMKPPSGHDFVDTQTKSLASNPRIQLLHLPPSNDPPPPQLSAKSIFAYICNFIESYTQHVKTAVTNILSASAAPDSVTVVAGLILDLLCLPMIDAGKECGLPSFTFLTSNAGFLALQLYKCSHHDQTGREFRYSDGDYIIPGLVDPVPPQVLPTILFDKCEYEVGLKIAQRIKDSSGIIVNTFSELESYEINYFLDDGKTPPIYPVGPVLNLRGQDHPDLHQEQLLKIMNWLDKQPQSSVVFLCFGSMGILEPPQVKELALGLEQSGYRFLWSLRAPHSVKNPEEMLPEGFLERIGERGMICGWAPQVQVLAHEATGCFISHCGWNSFLESLWYGVPVIPFPLYAEQHLNAFMMTRECALAVELKFERREDGDFVMAEEVARAVERAMGGDSQVRKNVKEMSEKAKKAVMEGGSSSQSITQFLKDIPQDNN